MGRIAGSLAVHLDELARLLGLIVNLNLRDTISSGQQTFPLGVWHFAIRAIASLVRFMRVGGKTGLHSVCRSIMAACHRSCPRWRTAVQHQNSAFAKSQPGISTIDSNTSDFGIWLMAFPLVCRFGQGDGRCAESGSERGDLKIDASKRLPVLGVIADVWVERPRCFFFLAGPTAGEPITPSFLQSMAKLGTS